MQYDKDELVSHLVDLASELGRIPSGSDMDNAEGFPSSGTYKYRFGSWNEALDEAGFEPDSVGNRSQYEREELLDYLRQYYSEFGKIPTHRGITEADGYPSSACYIYRFGTWSKALEEAGLESRDRGRQVKYEREELLDCLRQYHSEFGEIPTMSDITEKDGYPSAETYHYRFDSWEDAVRLAGFENGTRGTYDAEELIKHMVELADELGRAPTSAEMEEADGRPSTSTYLQHFGDWDDVRKESGMYPTYC